MSDVFNTFLGREGERMKTRKLNLTKNPSSDGYASVSIEWQAEDVSPSELDAVMKILYSGKIPGVKE